MDNIVVSNFKLQLCNHIDFWTNTIEKSRSSLTPPPQVVSVVFFYKLSDK